MASLKEQHKNNTKNSKIQEDTKTGLIKFLNKTTSSTPQTTNENMKK